MSKEQSKIYTLEVEGHKVDEYTSLKSMLSVLLMNFITAPIRQMELVAVFVLLDSELKAKILFKAVIFNALVFVATLVGIFTGDDMWVTLIAVFISLILVIIVFLFFKLREFEEDDDIESFESNGLKNIEVVEEPLECSETVGIASELVPDSLSALDEIDAPDEMEIDLPVGSNRDRSKQICQDLFGEDLSDDDFERAAKLKEGKLNLEEIREQYDIQVDEGVIY